MSTTTRGRHKYMMRDMNNNDIMFHISYHVLTVRNLYNKTLSKMTNASTQSEDENYDLIQNILIFIEQ